MVKLILILNDDVISFLLDMVFFNTIIIQNTNVAKKIVLKIYTTVTK